MNRWQACYSTDVDCLPESGQSSAARSRAVVRHRRVGRSVAVDDDTPRGRLAPAPPRHPSPRLLFTAHFRVTIPAFGMREFGLPQAARD
jgi:hypothetical protein